MISRCVNCFVIVFYFGAKPVAHMFIDVAAAYLLGCKI
jgi:hypothetical protein